MYVCLCPGMLVSAAAAAAVYEVRDSRVSTPLELPQAGSVSDSTVETVDMVSPATSAFLASETPKGAGPVGGGAGSLGGGGAWALGRGWRWQRGSIVDVVGEWSQVRVLARAPACVRACVRVRQMCACASTRVRVHALVLVIPINCNVS